MPVDLLLEEMSVVVTAEFRNPSILNHNFLVSDGIMPSDRFAAYNPSTVRRYLDREAVGT